MNKDMTTQEVAEKWAAELRRIYSNKTAGDHTFIGVLHHFYTEMKQAEKCNADKCNADKCNADKCNG